MAQAAAVAGGAGSLMGAYGTYQQGKEAKKAADFDFAQYLQEASNTRATSQLQAAEERRKGRLLESRIKTLGAAGGGVDRAVMENIKDVTGEAEYRALTSIFEGEDKARGLEDAALMRKKEGKSAKKAATYAAIGSLLKTGSSMAKSYG